MTDERPSNGSLLDLYTPNTARIWDYQLGGKDTTRPIGRPRSSLTRRAGMSVRRMGETWPG